MIPVSRPHIAETDIQAVSDALREGFVSGEAPIVAAFEQEFASAVNRRHGIAVSNGSVIGVIFSYSLASRNHLEYCDHVILTGATCKNGAVLTMQFGSSIETTSSIEITDEETPP